MTQTNLFVAYQSLPESVQQWLNDENVILMIDEINQKLNLSIEDETAEIIPNLILRLCVQDLSPRDFINELSHYLDISFESAKTLTKEIEEKILKPIEAPLKIDVGVDLKLLYFVRPQSDSDRMIGANPALRPVSAASPVILNEVKDLKSDSSPPTATQLRAGQNDNIKSHSERSEESLAEVKDFKSDSSPPTATQLRAGQNDSAEPEHRPFILHQEESASSAGSAGSPQASSGQAAQPSFSYKVPINQTPAKPAPPPRAQIQTPSIQPASAQGYGEARRVVHYSGFFTKLFSPEKNQEKKSAVPLPKSKWFI